ncbi:MAG TPA: [Fe-Fe] hydrogenase large subunit C-terminal domain-containing protein, partial [Candidatus Wallbacteria bacterium]|nr:[Fe-Fe] hydrogenase large subunit C-terminal domain-containing protein [Candidatus Wallbacteria bacterium]
MIDNDRKIIYTSKARCRDCYRCLRQCPVKAIRMSNGQAVVDDERCISCGTCVLECPQKAKAVRNDTGRAASLIASGATVALSVAPSFAAVFPGWMQKRLVSAVRKLGFRYVAETSIGAEITAKLTADELKSRSGRPLICSACPAVVSYIEKYKHDMVKNIATVVSPMIAHAKLIKNKLGSDAKVVFAGPCIAKKSEAQRPEYEGIVDVVLTFAELSEWLAQENVNLSECEESGFDDTPRSAARFFPLAGGLARTAMLET